MSRTPRRPWSKAVSSIPPAIGTRSPGAPALALAARARPTGASFQRNRRRMLPGTDLPADHTVIATSHHRLSIGTVTVGPRMTAVRRRRRLGSSTERLESARSCPCSGHREAASVVLNRASTHQPRRSFSRQAFPMWSAADASSQCLPQRWRSPATDSSQTPNNFHEIVQNRLALLGKESVSVGHRRHPLSGKSGDPTHAYLYHWQ